MGTLNLGGLKMNNNSNGELTSLNLSKGFSLDLDKFSNLEVVRLGLGWKGNKSGPNIDLDASAILLDKNGLVTCPKDVVFYNALDTGKGVRSMGDNKVGSFDDNEGDDEEIITELNKIPDYVESILFIVTIHQAKEKHLNFGMIEEAYIRCINNETGEEIARYSMSDEFALQTALEIGRLVRTKRGWEFQALGNATNEDLMSILIRYGVR